MQRDTTLTFASPEIGAGPAALQSGGPPEGASAAPAPRRNFDAGPRPAITIRGLKKHFGGAVLYDGLDLDIPQGRFISVFGPNGCGKSTLINLISGLIPIDGGEILFDGRGVRDVTIGYVFQNYRDALFPWMSARDNIEYPLKVRGWATALRQARVDELVAQFEVGFDLKRRPYELSGGQQQLVSILRALAPKPEVMFLDEPFSALDYEMTLFIRERLQTVFMQTGVTMLLVSHDLEEAVYLADHVLLLTKRPTQVADIVDVVSPRPRNEDTLSDPMFVATKARSLNIFKQEVRR
jgi:NitT/TauT family transport system ATP-binding protein